MPAPVPGTVWIEHHAGRIYATFEQYWSPLILGPQTNHSRNRSRRAATILQRVIRGTWVCRWCGGEIPTDRRADARYCREGCRKADARARRAERKAWELTG